MKVSHKGLEMAQLAKNLVLELEKKKDKEEYLRRAKGLGSMIIQNGLAGTVLFLKKKGPQEILEHLDKLIAYKTKIENVSEKIVKDIKSDQEQHGELTSEQYLKAQNAALEAAKWLRRYADILLGGDRDEGVS
ncbi:MAG TPA: type III-B CRISPR module-associated protein Cmr5 [Thermotogae bacterium]|nr:type III-B CRISPR module-associated protein Cmr5 [Thermotogota bacterium]